MGLFFKVAAVRSISSARRLPGSPTSITSFMAACVKLAALARHASHHVRRALVACVWDWLPCSG